MADARGTDAELQYLIAGGNGVSASQRWRFLRNYFNDRTCVGAVAPSSRLLAEALCTPFRRRAHPAKVLEVGAGTGAITRHLGSLLGDQDELDICELKSAFVDVLEQTVLTGPNLAPAVAEGRVRLLRAPIQDLQSEREYDFVISGLPLTAFELRDVKSVFKVIRRCLKPGGVFSYFEYVGLRRTSRTLTVGSQRKRIRYVSAYLSRRIRAHEFDRQTVLRNFPPAYARHLRFD
ncbi:MAG: class I SAM-dependent methyltransferase [Planctomycetes bacterium]|nr:class I SAM-dependent methyltransferase [Planctomycetota bacterium]